MARRWKVLPGGRITRWRNKNHPRWFGWSPPTRWFRRMYHSRERAFARETLRRNPELASATRYGPRAAQWDWA